MRYLHVENYIPDGINDYPPEAQALDYYMYLDESIEDDEEDEVADRGYNGKVQQTA